MFLALRDLICTHSPSFVNKITQRRVERIRVSLSFEGCFVVDCRGKSGGLILFWHNSVSVFIQSFSMGHIDSVIIEGSRYWRFIGFYGNPRAADRCQSWELLCRLSDMNGMPWLVGGNFNEILFNEDKIGGANRRSGAMIEFQGRLDGCEL